MQVAHPDCGEASTQDHRIRNCRTPQLIKGVAGFVLTKAGINRTTLLETLQDGRKPAKPEAVAKEQSWAVCRGMCEDDQREELGREKKEKEKQKLSSDMMIPASEVSCRAALCQ